MKTALVVVGLLILLGVAAMAVFVFVVQNEVMVEIDPDAATAPPR